jgi:molybdate transport system substrate-binding protein
MNRSLTSAVIVLALGAAHAARADEITIIAPGGIRAALTQIIPEFEKKTGHKVVATFGSGLGTKKQVAAGEPFDVTVVQPPYPEVLASGHVVASTATPLASVSVGVAVKTGAPAGHLHAGGGQEAASGREGISTDPAGGAARRQLRRNAEDAGIAEQMKSKMRPAREARARWPWWRRARSKSV